MMRRKKRKARTSDMYAYFDRSFIGYQHWIKNQVKLFGDSWLSCECGLSWKRQIIDMRASPLGTTNTKFEFPESPADRLTWKGLNGIQFTKLHVIEFYKMFLQVVETDDDGKGETIGWIESNSLGFWLDELTNVALRLILPYASIEGKHCHQDGHASILRLTCIPRATPRFDQVPRDDRKHEKHHLRHRR